LAVILSLLAIYDFVSLYIPNIKFRKVGTLLISMGGGLGWLQLFFPQITQNRPPLEFYSPEAFGFLAEFSLPHLALGRALLLWGLVVFLSDRNSESKTSLMERSGLIGGVLWLLLGFLQPLTVPLGWCLLATYLAVTWLKIRYFCTGDMQQNLVAWRVAVVRAAWMIVLSAPMVVYIGVLSLTDLFFLRWSSQNLVLSPPFLDYLISYGMFLPFAFGGAWKGWRSTEHRWLLPIGWLAILPVLIYAPVNMQRRLAEGVWAAIVTLAILGFGRLCDSPHRSKFLGLAIVFSLIPSAVFWSMTVKQVLHPEEPLFLPNNQIDLFKRLAAYSGNDTVVLADHGISNALPAWAPVRTIIGLGPESINDKELRQVIERIYTLQMSDSEILGLIEQQNINMIVVKQGDSLFIGWMDNQTDLFNHEYENDKYLLYRKLNR
jgi:hypothetical protein